MRCCGGDGGNSEIESIRIENLSLGSTSAYKVAEIRRPPWRGLKRWVTPRRRLGEPPSKRQEGHQPLGGTTDRNSLCFIGTASLSASVSYFSYYKKRLQRF